jgi:ubiquinone/menaquinone biosynthesis C-methylase UbiE
MNSTMEQEVQRIRAESERRRREIPSDYYALHHPANLFIRQGQERGLCRALITADAIPLSGRAILEVGCGSGQWLASFKQFGARSEDLAVIDLNTARVRECATHFAGADVRVGNAASLPWPDGRFDIVFQSIVFTSILSDEMKVAVAREMLRVLRKDGVVLWYDFMVNNPRNPNVRDIARREIRRLFPGCALLLRRVTPAPPIVRKLVPFSWTLGTILECFRLLNTHYFGVIRMKV